MNEYDDTVEIYSIHELVEMGMEKQDAYNLCLEMRELARKEHRSWQKRLPNPNKVFLTIEQLHYLGFKRKRKPMLHTDINTNYSEIHYPEGQLETLEELENPQYLYNNI